MEMRNIDFDKNIKLYIRERRNNKW